MGLLTMGPPYDLTTKLALMHGVDCFVESGTYLGGTAKWASRNFLNVFTIERSVELFNKVEPTLGCLRNVIRLNGDSRECLPEVIKDIGDLRAIYWLDGHWSGGLTAGEGDECPLLEELSILLERANDIILIDDARLFLKSPPLPHNAEQWPSILDICDIISRSPSKRFVQIFDDVIFVIPDTPSLKDVLIDWGRNHARENGNGF